MTDVGILTDLLVIFAISIGIVFVFYQFRLPPIAGFLAAGALIGPHGLNLVSDIEQVKVLAEIGVVLLLFTIGVEFSLAHLTAARRLLLIGGPLQVTGSLLLAAAVGIAVGLPVQQALLWGCLLSLSSTAIVLKALAERGESDTLHGRATVGILIFQDLAVVPMILLLPLLANSGNSLRPEILLPLGKSVVLVGALMAVSWFVVPKLLEQIVRHRSRELFLLTTIVLCLGIAWLTALSGLSLALGAFIAGLVISESEYSHQALAEVLPFRDSFNSLFFVSIGMLMDVRTLLAHPVLVAALVGAVLVGKFVTGAIPVVASGYPPRVGILSGIALAQVGEFSFVVAQQGERIGLLTGEPYQVFLVVSVLTMVITPFLMQGAPYVARKAEAIQWLRQWSADRTIAHQTQAAPGELKIRDHVIVLGYGLSGRNLVRVLKETDIPYVALDLDSEIVRREAQTGAKIIYGDATSPGVLHHVRIGDARVLVVAISDPSAARHIVPIARGLNPTIHIVVRTRYLREMDDLHQLGADEVVPEEFEASIEIFALVLQTYKMPLAVIAQKAEQIRKDGYALLRRDAHGRAGGDLLHRGRSPRGGLAH